MASKLNHTIRHQLTTRFPAKPLLPTLLGISQHDAKLLCDNSSPASRTSKRHPFGCLFSCPSPHKKGDAFASPFCVSINPCRACSLSSSQGELEGAKPASNRIKCRAKPCSARRAWSEASIFVPLRGTKITALLQAVEKSQRLFRQPERRRFRVSFFIILRG